MSDSEEKKPTPKAEVVPMMSKITEDKLIGPNYLEWSKAIRIYIRSVHMGGHLTKDSPADNSKEKWMEEDARLFIQIRNSIDNKVLGLVNHCEFVKELMDCLEFVFSEKGNVSCIFDMCTTFYRSEKQDQSLTEFFMHYRKIYEKLNMLMPFSPDVKVQQSQREQMVVMGFLAALPSEYDSAKAQIMSSPEISSLQETFSRILSTEVSSFSVSSPTLVSTQRSSALVG